MEVQPTTRQPTATTATAATVSPTTHAYHPPAAWPASPPTVCHSLTHPPATHPPTHPPLQGLVTSTRPEIYDVNLRMVNAMLSIGRGASHLYTLLAHLSIPVTQSFALKGSGFARIENELLGPQLVKEAEESCRAAEKLEVEIQREVKDFTTLPVAFTAPPSLCFTYMFKTVTHVPRPTGTAIRG